MTVALPPLDRDGYLADLDHWSPAVAALLAEEEGIALTDAHWEILHLLRDFHERFQVAPNNRVLVRAVKDELGPERGRSIHLMKLFGSSPALTAARIAGLPRPTNCL